MKEHEFAIGMTMGMAAGAALGIMMAPQRKSAVKKAADKAVKTMGEMVETISDEMGLR